jgi:hypothetical protein
VKIKGVGGELECTEFKEYSEITNLKRLDDWNTISDTILKMAGLSVPLE